MEGFYEWEKIIQRNMFKMNYVGPAGLQLSNDTTADGLLEFGRVYFFF
jgi:hypothetical protein